MILQPGERGSNSSRGKREPYIRKNVIKRNYTTLTSEAIERRGLRLTKPQYIKRDLFCRTFGELVVLDCVGVVGGKAWWSVICLCGNIDVIRADQLIRGRSLRLRCCASYRGGNHK